MKPTVFILAGGRGERLWPLSTPLQSKPFLPLFEGKSLIELTLKRAQSITSDDRIFIITAASLRETVKRALPDFPETHLLCEPYPRNTAAAIAWACGHLYHKAPQGIGIVLPADHCIGDETQFQTSLTTACTLAQQAHAIVTIGIHPTRPATEYGYIACGTPMPQMKPLTWEGIGFTEKPTLGTAQTYLKAGTFLWNAGIFVWEAATLKAQFEAHAPAYLPLIEAPSTIDESLYQALPAIAFDYAIMEKCAPFYVVKGDFEWNDVGSYSALAQQFPADAAGNRTNAPAQLHEVKGCTLLSTEQGHTFILAHTTDLLVAHTPEATLICPAAEAHRVTQWIPATPKDAPHPPSSSSPNERFS